MTIKTTNNMYRIVLVITYIGFHVNIFRSRTDFQVPTLERSNNSNNNHGDNDQKKDTSTKAWTASSFCGPCLRQLLTGRGQTIGRNENRSRHVDCFNNAYTSRLLRKRPAHRIKSIRRRSFWQQWSNITIAYGSDTYVRTIVIGRGQKKKKIMLRMLCCGAAFGYLIIVIFCFLDGTAPKNRSRQRQN